MIRSATPLDTTPILKLIESFCIEMGYPYDPMSCLAMLTQSAVNGWMWVVWEENGVVLGMAGVMVAPHIADRRQLRAIEFVWHSDPSLSSFKRGKIMLKLLNAMEMWAKGKNLPLTVNSGYKSGGGYSLMKHLRLRGYEIVETSFVKGV